ncbi:MAG: hypothetical protein ACKO37_05640 [Vampirovibrionales bacterium]
MMAHSPFSQSVKAWQGKPSVLDEQYGQVEQYLAQQYVETLQTHGQSHIVQNDTEVIRDALDALAYQNMLHKPALLSQGLWQTHPKWRKATIAIQQGL